MQVGGSEECRCATTPGGCREKRLAGGDTKGEGRARGSPPQRGEAVGVGEGQPLAQGELVWRGPAGMARPDTVPRGGRVGPDPAFPSIENTEGITPNTGACRGDAGRPPGGPRPHSRGSRRPLGSSPLMKSWKWRSPRASGPNPLMSSPGPSPPGPSTSGHLNV